MQLTKAHRINSSNPLALLLLLLMLIIPFSAHATSVTIVSDASTLFAASGTDEIGLTDGLTAELAVMDSAVQSGTYPTPNLPVIVATQGTGIYQIPGTSIVNSNPSSYYVGVSGYYQTSFVLPVNFSNASLSRG